MDPGDVANGVSSKYTKAIFIRYIYRCDLEASTKRYKCVLILKLKCVTVKKGIYTNPKWRHPRFLSNTQIETNKEGCY